MRLRCKMNDSVYLLVLHELIESLEVADVHLHELIVRPVLDILQIGKITGISKLVDIDYLIIRIFIHEKTYDMASDEAGSAGDYDISSHSLSS